MRYMLFYGCDDRSEPGDPGFEVVAECARRGVFVGGEPLRPVSTANTVRIRGGETLITDGPFAETPEHLSGYYILDCQGLDEALESAALWPVAARGSVEVRPVDDIPGLGWQMDSVAGEA